MLTTKIQMPTHELLPKPAVAGKVSSSDLHIHHVKVCSAGFWLQICVEHWTALLPLSEQKA